MVAGPPAGLMYVMYLPIISTAIVHQLIFWWTSRLAVGENNCPSSNLSSFPTGLSPSFPAQLRVPRSLSVSKSVLSLPGQFPAWATLAQVSPTSIPMADSWDKVG